MKKNILFILIIPFLSGCIFRSRLAHISLSPEKYGKQTLIVGLERKRLGYIEKIKKIWGWDIAVMENGIVIYPKKSIVKVFKSVTGEKFRVRYFYLAPENFYGKIKFVVYIGDNISGFKEKEDLVSTKTSFYSVADFFKLIRGKK